MAPDVALAKLRELVDDGAAEVAKEEPNEEQVTWLLTTFVDVFDGLDQWIKKGGFLPTDWQRNR